METNNYSLYDFEMTDSTISIYRRYCEYDAESDTETCSHTNQITEGSISQYALEEVISLFNDKPSHAYYWLLKVKETGNYYPLPLLTESQKELVLHQLKQLEVTTY